jgi:hypothetical protein
MTHKRLLLAVAFVPAAVALVWLALNLISPWRQPGPVIRVQVGPDWERSAMFDSRALSCPEVEDNDATLSALRLRAVCSLEIAGERLAFTVVYERDNTLGRCTATYAGDPVPCASAILFYNSRLPGVHIASDLGLDPDSLRGLPGTNPIFYISEGTWFWVGNVAAAAITLGALWIVGRQVSLAAFGFGARALRAGLYLFSGALLFTFVWYAMLIVKLSVGLVD